jgi:hypothetical protein
MARRLASARELEPMDAMLARVQSDITVLVGGAPHENAPAEEELTGLRSFALARIRYLPGVGHFIHEEAMDVVMREVELAHTRRVAVAP